MGNLNDNTCFPKEQLQYYKGFCHAIINLGIKNKGWIFHEKHRIQKGCPYIYYLNTCDFCPFILFTGEKWGCYSGPSAGRSSIQAGGGSLWLV
jgi:hypothetical protein